jgi:hypothetical protein
MLSCSTALRRRAGARLSSTPADAAHHRSPPQQFRAGTDTKGRLIPPRRALRFQAMGASKIIGGVVAAALLLTLSSTAALAMPSRVAISAGSFFAAAAQCETQNLITPGQTDALIKALNNYLSAADQGNIQSGYARGLKDSTVYVTELKRWAPFTPDAASCYRVQGVLDDYKSQLDAD